jgi:hypothetical protein
MEVDFKAYEGAKADFVCNRIIDCVNDRELSCYKSGCNESRNEPETE